MLLRKAPTRFQVAFSFAGEQRRLVHAIAEEVENLLGESSVYYDDWFVHYLAGDDADLKLQGIYGEGSALVVVCLSGDYGNKAWTLMEHAAVRARTMKARASTDERERHGVLPLRVGDGNIDGLLFNAVAPDVRRMTTKDAAHLIVERLRLTGAALNPTPGRPAPLDSGLAQGAQHREVAHSKQGALTQESSRLVAGRMRELPSMVGPVDSTAAWATNSGSDMYGSWAEAVAQGIAVRFRWIPPGRFIMGSRHVDDAHRALEAPRHLVVWTYGRWLSATPVVQALWESTMKSNPSLFRGPSHPVEGVTWTDCQLFIARFGALLRGCRVGLPTEAEWEYACRAGSDGPTLGATLGDLAWYDQNSGGRSHPVGEKLPNAWGMLDMLGNVNEWCADSLERYRAEDQVDPSAPQTTGESRVIRGGSWLSSAIDVRADRRLGYPATARNIDIGFRLAVHPFPRSR